MITVVSRWENDPNIATLEYRLWRQLSNFGIDRFVFVPKIKELSNLGIEQYDTMEEALNHVPDGNRVFLESTGHNSMNDLPPRDEDVVFILGNSSTNNVKHMKDNESYRINEPRVTDMYPTCAGAIVLAFWYGQ
ncbi:hypothetical protein LCGC14_1375420 [marine sediment metagenome]|uniref:tRNA/rRNA methyltransferase SpoU type domain-containing protein n=1 Tax=marine sediment metagenome TaxID=412755 RepID=A0A0F9MJF8_9ZZZZ